jgi:hypothetical protein
MVHNAKVNIILPHRLTQHGRFVIAHPNSAFGGTSFIRKTLYESGGRLSFKNYSIQFEKKLNEN